MEGEVTPTVHIESDEPVTLYDRGPAGIVSSDKPVCASPCGEKVDASQRRLFYVAGDGIPESRGVRLDRSWPDVTVEVSPGNNDQLAGGSLMLSFGAPTLIAGILTLSLIELFDVVDDKRWSYAGGAITVSVGAGLIGGGIALMATAGTSVHVREGKPDGSFHLDSRPAAIAPNHWLGPF